MSGLPVGSMHPSAVILRRWRLSCRLWRAGGAWRLCARFIRGSIQRRFGCYLSPTAEVGESVYLPHPIGIVVGDGVKVGRGAILYQNVTIGQRTGRDGGYPVIGAGAVLYAGSVVVGDITIGACSIVGANSVVLRDVPPGMTAVGAPARNMLAADG